MSDYTDLLVALIDSPTKSLKIELEVAESSLRRGLKVAQQKYNEVQAILDQPEVTDVISIKRVPDTDNQFLLQLVPNTATTKVRFTILPDTGPEEF